MRPGLGSLSTTQVAEYIRQTATVSNYALRVVNRGDRLRSYIRLVHASISSLAHYITEWVLADIYAQFELAPRAVELSNVCTLAEQYSINLR